MGLGALSSHPHGYLESQKFPQDLCMGTSGLRDLKAPSGGPADQLVTHTPQT